jgi:hypothetical protein
MQQGDWLKSSSWERVGVVARIWAGAIALGAAMLAVVISVSCMIAHGCLLF